MRRPPRNRIRGIFTRPVVTLMVIGGLWSALVNLGIFTWALRSGRSQAEAMTITFVTLVTIEFFKAYNFRSDRHSAFRNPFANKWLNLAIAWELSLLGLILYVPFPRSHANFRLSAVDWAAIIGVALTSHRSRIARSGSSGMKIRKAGLVCVATPSVIVGGRGRVDLCRKRPPPFLPGCLLTGTIVLLTPGGLLVAVRHILEVSIPW
jgi:magnesium-transporting ATPase (P-type)